MSSRVYFFPDIAARLGLEDISDITPAAIAMEVSLRFPLTLEYFSLLLLSCKHNPHNPQHNAASSSKNA